MEILNTGVAKGELWKMGEEDKVYMGTEETTRRMQKENMAGRNVHVGNGRKEEVSCKLTFFPSLREEEVNYVYPTSNFQIFSHSFPSILVVFLGLRMEHFCSDFRFFFSVQSPLQ